MSVFIMDDAYQMQNTLMKGGCIEFGMHLCPIMGDDSRLRSLCIGVA